MQHHDTELWALEWSHKSNNLHVQPAGRLAGMNMSRFVLDSPARGDYVVLAFGTHKEVNRAANQIRPTIIKRGSND